MKFYLYPVVTVDADTEAEAADAVIEAIFGGSVGEIPGWLPGPSQADPYAMHRTVPWFHEERSNPVTALDMQTSDGATLRFKLPEVQQARVMAAMGELHGRLGVELDVVLPNHDSREE